MKGYILVTGLILGVLAGSCRPKDTHSVIPEISFKSFYVHDSVDPLGNIGTVGSLVFSFIDGDGDIGFNENDTTSVVDTTDFNLFFTLYYLDQGFLEKVGDEDIQTPLEYRIPYLEKGKTDNVLSGEIQVDFFYLLFPYDTIAYDFFLIDRAGHQSNIESTPLIVLDTLGI
jgi:hypothetical protein